ncbi:MAG: hypothetical protein KH972_07915 [Peptostreptococcaceae bacterium]|nr:hypothetical protein [Peptostreptococcaceae bacterium]
MTEEQRVLQAYKKLKAEDNKKECNRDKKYIEASKKLMFLIIALVFIVFIENMYLSFNLKSVDLAKDTLDKVVLFSGPVLTALIVKSGFENIRKGKIREQIINKLDNVELGQEDFRNGGV